MSNIIKVRDNNGNWLGIPALKGVDGITPHIGENGNWFIGADDTGVAAGGLTELPIASADTLGAVKVGNNLTIDENGVLNGKDVDLTSYAQKSELPTKVSDLTNDSLFITNTVNNLTNYYTKTETYTQEQINNLISAAASLKLEVVSALPTTDISTSTIYLKGTETSGTNDYEEWIYVNNNWEMIGTTAVDLTGYLTETDLQNVMTQKNACIMPKKYIDVLDGWKIASTRVSDSEVKTELLYTFLYNFFSTIDGVFKGTKEASTAMTQLQEYTYASSEPYTSNFGTVFSALQQMRDVFNDAPCRWNDYTFEFTPFTMLNSFNIDVHWGTITVSWRVQLGRTIALTRIDEADLATKEYADNTKIYAQIYDLQHNNAINDYKINITKLAAPYVLRGYANNMQSFISSGIIDCEGLGTALAGTSFVLTCGGRSETISFSDTDSVASEADLSSLLTRKIDAAFGRDVYKIEALPIIVNVSMNILYIGNPTGIYMPISIAHPSEGTSALDILLLDDGANNHILLDQTLEAWFDNDYFVTHSDITITINNSSFTFYKDTTVQQVIDSINNDKSCDFIVALDATTLEFTLTAKTIDLNTTCAINAILDNGDTNVLWAGMGLDAPVASGAQHAEFYLIDNNGTYYHRLQSQTNEYLLGNRFKIVLCDVTNSKYKPVIPMYDMTHKCDQIQYATMPEANVSMNNQIVQYTGNTISDYKQGSFYKCAISPIRPIENVCDFSTRYFESVTCDNNIFKPTVDSSMTIGDSYVVKASGTELTVTKNTETIIYTQTYESMTWEAINTILNPIGIDVVPKRTGAISSNITIVTIAINEGLPVFAWQEVSFAGESTSESANAITLETTEATYYAQLQELFYNIYQNHINGAKVPTIHMVFTDVATRSDFLTCLTIGNNTMTWETKSKIGVRATSSDSVLQHEIYNYVVTIGASATETTWEQKGYFDGIGTTSRYLDTETNYTTPYEPIFDGSPATKKYVDEKAAPHYNTTYCSQVGPYYVVYRSQYHDILDGEWNFRYPDNTVIDFGTYMNEIINYAELFINNEVSETEIIENFQDYNVQFVPYTILGTDITINTFQQAFYYLQLVSWNGWEIRARDDEFIMTKNGYQVVFTVNDASQDLSLYHASYSRSATDRISTYDAYEWRIIDFDDFGFDGIYVIRNAGEHTVINGPDFSSLSNKNAQACDILLTIKCYYDDAEGIIKTEQKAEFNNQTQIRIYNEETGEWSSWSTLNYATEEYVNNSVSNKVDANGVVTNVWVGTQAEYDAIATKSNTTLYMIKA